MATRIYERTGSTLAVSFLWVFSYLPAFLLGPFSGLFVDWWSRRKTLLYTNLLQALTMALYLFMGDRIYPIYPIVFLYSLLNQFYCPAEAASIPWLVKKSDLPLANSLFMLTSQSALVFGLGVSGILIRFFGRNNPVWVAAVCLFLAAVAVYFLPKNEPVRPNWFSSLSRFWRQMKAGYSFIKNTRLILFPLLLMISFQVFAVILAVTVPGLAKNVLNIQIHDAGPLLVVPLGLGALTGALLMTRLAGRFRKRWLMKNGLGLGLFVLTAFAFLIPRLGQYKTVAAMPLMYLLGLAGFLVLVPNQTLVQEHTPPGLRGRVYGALSFFGNLVTLPCLLFAATVVDLIGIQIFILLAAGVVLTMMLIFDRMERFILAARAAAMPETAAPVAVE
jgi:MFS family permease